MVIYMDVDEIHRAYHICFDAARLLIEVCRLRICDLKKSGNCVTSVRSEVTVTF